MPRWMLSIQAAQENGTTIPVVPRMDKPPTMPRRPFNVRAANASPSGMEISTTTSRGAPKTAATSVTAERNHLAGHWVDRRLAGRQRQAGAGDRADAGTGAKCYSGARQPRVTVARISAPWVTSGSSPASFTTAALAARRPVRFRRGQTRRARRVARSLRPGRERRRRAAPRRRPWRRRWRRCRWSSPGARMFVPRRGV